MPASSAAAINLQESGTLGYLTVDQQSSLKEAWAHLLRLCGQQNVGHGIPDKSQQFLEHLDDKSPDNFNHALWAYILLENPDALVLRYLRARKWDVAKGVEMLVSAINWREQQRINTRIIEEGESVGLKTTRTQDEEAFIMQYRSGKSYIRGADNNGHPVYIIKVKLHDPNKQSASVMESFALHNIETLRVMAKSRGDKVCLIFDLTAFGLRNMDFHFIKFLIQILEARYPETLEVVLIHNAPFVFWGIWNVIKHWLDPCIASKIHFTSGNKGMVQFIPKENLQKCYGGDDPWEYKYVEPEPTENARMGEKEKRIKLVEEREDIIARFSQLTADWLLLDVEAEGEKEKSAQRSELVRDLDRNYWYLDPYIRATTYYHRVGVLDRFGKVDFKAAR